MNVFEAETLDDVYPKLCQALLDDGERHSPRGLDTFDLGPTTLVIQDPAKRILTNSVRKIHPYFLLAEFIWIITRQKRADTVGFYNKKMWDFSDDGKTLFGAYGPRLMYQLPALIGKLNNDRSTRQAIATIFQPHDQLVYTKDFPCNIMLHFLPRGDELNLVTYVRSQDVYLGLPYDFYHWSMILEIIANETHFNVGTYTHICGSLHYYDINSTQISNIANSEPENILDFYEPPVKKQPESIHAISTIEFKNRKNLITLENYPTLYNEIQSIPEDQLIKNILSTLLYFKVRRLNIPNREEMLGGIGYGPLLKHLSWA